MVRLAETGSAKPAVWNGQVGQGQVNFRIAQVYRPMLSVEGRSTNTAHPFSFFCSNCLTSVPQSIVYVKPCRLVALASIPSGRGAKNDWRRAA